MTGIVDWASERARMVVAFIVISLIAGATAYINLPKEGEPDIDIPALFVSVPFPGISAEDSEALLVKPMETELSDLDGLKSMSATASEGYGGVALEFEFGWDKTKIIADVRDKMNTVEGDFPAGADKYTINEINFSEFPIIIVNLSGDLPERTLVRIGKDLQDRLETLEPVLEAALAGHRDEMVEVTIDPLRLEAYNVTAPELINVVVNNNQLIAAGEIETPNGAFSVKIPSSFKSANDIFDLPVKTNGDRVVTLGDLADIRLTFEDRIGTARYNGETTVALQVVKRKGFNIIDTAAEVRAVVAQAQSEWPEQLQVAVDVGTSNDQSRQVNSMVSQLEGSVLTAIALVMIVVLATLGTRSALLVGFSIPTSFLLCFVLLGAMGITISNIVMFGLILAVGMLVDGAIVVVEYADRRIKEGVGPMHAFTEAAKRMFWPIVSSTATTLCAFLPMLFWPGVPGQFMGMLPVTLIFVLSASLVVALVYLPVLGGVFGRGSRMLENVSAFLIATLPWFIRAAIVPFAFYGLFLGMMQLLNPGYLFGGEAPSSGVMALVPGALIFMFSAFASSAFLGAAALPKREKKVRAGVRRSPFGLFIKFIVGNPIMPLVTIAGVVFLVMTTFSVFSQNSKGVEFFVESEPEQAIIYVRQRGNLSLEEKDQALRSAEEIILAQKGVQSTFAFAGDGGLTQNDGGAGAPRDAIAQVQIELIPWEDRPTVKIPWFMGLERNSVDPDYNGKTVLEQLKTKLSEIPGIKIETIELTGGPASGKPVHLRLKSDSWTDLQLATNNARAQFEATPGLADIDDTLPLPGIDWQINVDVQKAGRYGADVATVGGMVQLVTRGILLDTMRVDTSDEEIEIRVRLPEEDRVLSTLDSLRIRTSEGLVPLSNFITREPVKKLAQIDRIDQQRYFDVKAAVDSDLVKLVNADTQEEIVLSASDLENVNANGMTYQSQIDDGIFKTIPVNPTERIETLTKWLEADGSLPEGVTWEWTGDQEDQAESGAFLMKAFAGALALMFVILLAQFNSLYNSVLVLIAVVLSTTGVLIGMLVMDQAFSIIMTGTGIVALAGIVVNNNIVLIDTYQEYARYMPRIEAIVRTAQNRIRPVLLTTITTMAGLAPMMFGLSLDFINGGYSVNSPTALWWTQLATAVVFGLGIATILTLVFTPSMLAVRVWFSTYVSWFARLFAKLSMGRSSRAAHDWALQSSARKLRSPELDWTTLITPEGENFEDEATDDVDLSELENVLEKTGIAPDATKDVTTKGSQANDADDVSNDTEDSGGDPPKSPKQDGPPLKAAE